MAYGVYRPQTYIVACIERFSGAHSGHKFVSISALESHEKVTTVNETALTYANGRETLGD